MKTFCQLKSVQTHEAVDLSKKTFILVIQTLHINGNKYGVLDQTDDCLVYKNKLLTEYIHLFAS